jgi:hypothetical protein
MNKVLTKLGAVLAFVFLVSTIEAQAATVNFRSHGWGFPAYLYIKAPGATEYVESHDHWGKGGSNDNLKKNTMVCIAVDTGVLEPTNLRAIYKKFYFEITKDTKADTFLDLYWPHAQPYDAFYGFGGKTIDQEYNNAGLVEDKNLSDVSIGLCNPVRGARQTLG